MFHTCHQTSCTQISLDVDDIQTAGQTCHSVQKRKQSSSKINLLAAIMPPNYTCTN